MKSLFYCYSKRLCLFLRSMNETYIDIGINPSRHTKYWTFQKSRRLDELIRLYKEIKYK